MLIPLVGYVLARLVLARTELVEGALALAAVVVPAGAGRPLAAPDRPRDGFGRPVRGRAQPGRSRTTRNQLDVFSDGSYRLAPEVVGRAGAVAVLALFAVPLAVLAARRRWAAFVIGGFLAVLALVLWPTLFTHFADAVSISQARRAAGFVPFPFAVAGGAAVLARLLSLGALPVGLGGGHRVPARLPGRLRLRARRRRARAGDVGRALRRRRGARRSEPLLPRRCTELDRMGPIAAATAALAVLPVALHGFTHWDERPTAARGLTPGSSGRCATACPRRRSCSPTTRRATRSPRFAPVYVADALPGHVADTKANRPYARRADAREFFRTGNLAIPRRYGATWLVVDRNRSKLRLDLPQLYSDPSYVLYRLG